MLHVDRRAGGIFRWADFAQQAVADRAHHRAGFAQQLTPLRHQLRGGGFTVGPGDANQAQPVGRLMVKTPRQRGEAFS